MVGKRKRKNLNDAIRELTQDIIRSTSRQTSNGFSQVIKQTQSGGGSQRQIVSQVLGVPRGSLRKKAAYAVRSRGESPQLRRGVKSRRVFVVHGRNLRLRSEVFAFLRALNLEPIEWTQSIRETNQGSPHISTILRAAFRHAKAVIVLLTPDDKAKLKKQFWLKSDPSYETDYMGQARANVLFEAGMAFAHNSKATILVQIGKLRPFSDIAGLHILHLDNSSQKRLEFATKLLNAGCAVNTSGTDWLAVGDFKV